MGQRIRVRNTQGASFPSLWKATLQSLLSRFSAVYVGGRLLEPDSADFRTPCYPHVKYMALIGGLLQSPQAPDHAPNPVSGYPYYYLVLAVASPSEADNTASRTCFCPSALGPVLPSTRQIVILRLGTIIRSKVLTPDQTTPRTIAPSGEISNCVLAQQSRAFLTRRVRASLDEACPFFGRRNPHVNEF